MTLLVGAWTIGLILALLALGVYNSFRVCRFSDITVDGSITLGAAVSAALLSHGVNPFIATGLSFLAGMLAGSVTGTLHTKFKINQLLSGILVMTALYSVNLRIMGKSNVPILGTTSLVTYAAPLGSLLSAGRPRIALWGWEVPAHDVALLVWSLVVAVGIALLLYAFHRTDLGTAMRATGDNDQMIRALGVNVDAMLIGGLALSNGLIALAGSLLAQYQGFADVQMGIGMVVWGLASVIIGEALVGGQYHLGLAVTGAVMGSVLFRLLVALVLRAGLNPNDLKLITAVFVFVALILPDVLKRFRSLVTPRQAGDKAAVVK
jgi:putative ABC transport system permease protein